MCATSLPTLPSFFTVVFNENHGALARRDQAFRLSDFIFKTDVATVALRRSSSSEIGASGRIKKIAQTYKSLISLASEPGKLLGLAERVPFASL